MKDVVRERARGAGTTQVREGSLSSDDVPADVAALYRWLNVQDLGYKEFAPARHSLRSEETEAGVGVGVGVDHGVPRSELDTSGEAGSKERYDRGSGVPIEGTPEKTGMLPGRVPTGQVSRLRWRIFEGNTANPGSAAVGRAQRARSEAASAAEPHGSASREASTPADPTSAQEGLQVEPANTGHADAQLTPSVGKPVAEVIQEVPEEPGAQDSQLADGVGQSSGERAPEIGRRIEDVVPAEPREMAAVDLPAWIEAYARRFRAVQRNEASGESLKRTRERIAARWYGLRGLLKARAPESSAAYEAEKEAMPPMLVLFSLPGGTGKTSLAASLTRVLASQGERVLLISVTQAETLPFHFGAGEGRTGDRRVFAPPAGVADAPVHVLRYPSDSASGGSAEETLASRVRRDSKGFSRVVVDLGPGDSKGVQALLGLGGCVLVPMVPDMNSLLALQTLRRTLAASAGEGGQAGQVWYLLTRFQAAEPLHLDIREVLEQELAEKLLPLAIRASTAVPEALAQGMTVVDYAPADGAAQDVQQLASWIRTLQEPAREGLARVRWSERQ